MILKRGFERLQRELDKLTTEIKAPGGWVALATHDGVELEGTRRPWTGDVGYRWEGKDVGAVDVYGCLRELEDGRLVFVGFDREKRLDAHARLELAPLGPLWKIEVR